jgi:hypothetical protein
MKSKSSNAGIDFFWFKLLQKVACFENCNEDVAAFQKKNILKII